MGFIQNWSELWNQIVATQFKSYPLYRSNFRMCLAVTTLNMEYAITEDFSCFQTFQSCRNLWNG
jgi:hypothetical protein